MCGIVGIFSHQSVFSELYDSLVHLQHRGQDACGIMTCDNRFHREIGKGLVRDVFDSNSINKLTGNLGIGHVRYPTAGENHHDEIQPLWTNSPYGISIAHNGNLINQDVLSQEIKRGHYLNTTSDTEVLLHLFAKALSESNPDDDPDKFFEAICNAILHLYKVAQGSYSVVALIVGKGLIAFRDPLGIRPLVLSSRKNIDQSTDYIFASEPTMFHSLGFSGTSNVQHGEVIYIDQNGCKHQKILSNEKFCPCIFEYIYFARPDSVLDDISVYRARLRMGQNLAISWKKKFPDILPDVVIPAPATSNTAALSFAHEIGVRYSEGLYKNPFIGRTFIMPNQEARTKSVKYKLSPQEIEIKNKKVLILDDSIVRGTTSKEIVSMVKECGAKEVYFVTASPPVKFPCFYGIDIPTRLELIAANMSEQEIKDFLQVEKLLYQTLPDLKEAVMRKGDHHIDSPCMACLDGCYPAGTIDENLCSQRHKKNNSRNA